MGKSMRWFAVATPDLELTGERIVPGKTPESLFREHEERYAFAAQYVPGKDVLDVACGTGVGTSFLRQAGARRVWGLDIDPDAIAFAKERYSDCEFAQSDAASMCLANSSVDVVVSFETLEHLKDQHKFLKECQRTLRPGGLIICSTPNRTIFKWWPPNPYHVHELTAEEFIEFVGMYFGGLSLLAQAERMYPLYVLRRLTAKTLDQLKLKARIKNILGDDASPDGIGRRVFGQNGNAFHGIGPHRDSSLFQATYLIALGRKAA